MYFLKSIKDFKRFFWDVSIHKQAHLIIKKIKLIGIFFIPWVII